jgi:hypothetical protein
MLMLMMMTPAAAADDAAGGDDDSYMPQDTQLYRAQFRCTKQVLNPAEKSSPPLTHRLSLLRGGKSLADTVQKTTRKGGTVHRVSKESVLKF